MKSKHLIPLLKPQEVISIELKMFTHFSASCVQNVHWFGLLTEGFIILDILKIY